MPILNAKTGNAYTQDELTDLIVERPRQPNALSARVQVTSQPVSVPALLIDRKGSTIDIVDPKPYGAPPKQVEVDRRKPIPLAVPHYPSQIILRATEVSGQRKAGSDNEFEMPEDLLNEKLDQQIAEFELTTEHILFGAARGQIVDSAGQVEVDLEAAFGIGPTAIPVDFDDPDLDPAAFFRAAKRTLKAKLGGMAVRSWQAVCTGELYEALVTKEAVKRSFDFYMQGAALRGMSNDGPTPFVLADNVEIWEYEGADLPSGLTIGPVNQILLIPNVQGLFQRRNAPKQGMGTVNTPGRPYYANQDDLDNKAGVKIDAEMNTIIYNTRPEGVGDIQQA